MITKFKLYENNEHPNFQKGDVVYLTKYILNPGPLEYGRPYVIKSCDNFSYPYSVYYQLEDLDLNYNFPENLFISEQEYLEKMAKKYNL
jgi:hypothetical protein